jgi:hypothetical protein
MRASQPFPAGAPRARIPGAAPAPVPSAAPARLSPERRGLLALRIGLGLVWAANFVFIAAPANQFFPTFAQSAGAFAPTTLGGLPLATWVSTQPVLFSGLIAALTGYLAVAFLTGFTMRLAVVLGAGFNLLLLLTQFGSTFFFPGGTDVGPQPLYLVLYAGLALGDASRSYSIDAWMARHLSGFPSNAFRWIGTRVPRAPTPG